MRKQKNYSVKKNPFLKGFFLLLPYPLVFLALIMATILLFQTFVESSPYFRLLTYDVTVNPSVVIPEPEQDEGDFPLIYIGDQWATLNVEGWEKKDVKVFLGDDKATLRKGAGMLFNSRFCGQGGKIVLSAHVTTDFHEREVTPVGARVTMDTIYGQYVYEVVDTLVFNYKNEAPVAPDDSEEVLFMYTCYPRKNGYAFKTERMALICKKIEGKDWGTDYE